MALALLDQSGQERPDTVDDAPEVHAEDPLPGRQGAGPGIGPAPSRRRCCRRRGRPEAVERGRGQRLDGDSSLTSVGTVSVSTPSA